MKKDRVFRSLSFAPSKIGVQRMRLSELASMVG
jgi:hypothetical protein